MTCDIRYIILVHVIQYKGDTGNTNEGLILPNHIQNVHRFPKSTWMLGLNDTHRLAWSKNGSFI